MFKKKGRKKKALPVLRCCATLPEGKRRYWRFLQTRNNLRDLNMMAAQPKKLMGYWRWQATWMRDVELVGERLK